MALKYAKDNGLPFWIYEDRMRFENEYEKNLNISNVVRHAVQNSKIVPYFQPIMDNKTSKINKYECLARLLDENNNVISPSLFIPIAKRIKVYNEVTKIIIEKSFKLFEANDYEFSINLSMEDIVNSEMFNFILQKLKLSSASNRVIFEIVESEAIQDFEKIARFIKEIKRYGARIAIDDFGDGYSNFSYLIKMNVDFLKIDGSLIKDIDTDRNAYLVVETIVDFASKLGVETIAEFVHSSTVMDKVKEMGIKYSQGYHIDKPSINIE
jgi:EAL domain-containing protein (putative c-di-GMP-specific phosphodiesterase class I)